MTDIIQPHTPIAPAEVEAGASNGSAPPFPDHAVPASFPELVLAHYDWRKAVALGRPSADLERAYWSKLQLFERENGRIVNSYWCLNVRSAVALTAKPHRLRWLGVGPKHFFHRVTDWATKDKPAIAAGLHRCDDIAIRAEQVLTGVRRRIAMQMAMASASHLLSLADEKAAHRDAVKVPKEEEQDLKACHRYYCDAANGQTQMVYFGGMGAFALLLVLLSILLHATGWIGDREFFGALLAGAFGAVVSVVARINSGRFDLEYDVGWAYPFFLGGLRPLIGGAFGLVIYFAVASKLLTIIPVPDNGDPKLFAILVVGFAAGFSERWAKDTLAVATGARPQEEGTPKPARATRTP
jgi:hypothetical protein